MSAHPLPKQIELMPLKLRPSKVWKHFYDPHERWDRICATDIESMRREAEVIVGIAREEKRELPRLPDEQQWWLARDLLVEHHDRAYGPTYDSEMRSCETWWGRSSSKKDRELALTPRSVFIVLENHVQNDRGRSRVVTAFRPHPQTQGVDWDEDEFRRHGEWYFKRERGVNTHGFATVVAENLRRVFKAPSSIKELWWLASAVGYGRLLQHEPEVKDVLLVAESALSGTPNSLLEELRGVLGWQLVLGRLAEALKEVRSEDLDGVLADAEELLMVGAVISAESDADTFCAEAEMLLPWMPVEWAHVAELASHHLSTFTMWSSPVVRLWSAVEDAATAAVIREQEPAFRPASVLVDKLIPQQSRCSILSTKFVDFAGPANVAAISNWIGKSIEGLFVAPLVPTMGGGDITDYEWILRGCPAPNAPHYRVFVVDKDYPDGYEVTEQFTEADGDLWRLESEEKVFVVMIAGERPLGGLSMAQVLDEAYTRCDVVVRWRELQPIQATKARR